MCTIISEPNSEVLARINRAKILKHQTAFRRIDSSRRRTRRSICREYVVGVESKVSRKGAEGFSVTYLSSDGQMREVFYLETTLPREAVEFQRRKASSAVA